ncbi:TIGR03086 family metal-binding protein [Yinghuangia sp. ASG 101]|uniref:TIGR03086 family metal-binding protein n=1 Tax=Yinghuangia sp. ASG 101 TaxID=2896848 RepID=UPI001E53435A|nr:TIGR03086 family metal-binding protein [Yinghuangia sp. ASG 101]UGQ11816.1 TIGR03086 family metal-binding protein [Yinghuangia sp. ASG 101]
MTTSPAAPAPDLGAAAALVSRVAAGVRDDQLDAPTPCPDYRVRNLLGHLVGLTAAFRDAARKDLGPSTSTNPGATLPDITDDWRTALPRHLNELAEAWREPGAWDGMTQAGGVTFPAADAGVVALNEVVVHGWDLARATGQDYPADPAALEACRAMLAPSADAAPEDRGPFGPAVAVPADAPLLDRVIALTGRHPAWPDAPATAHP